MIISIGGALNGYEPYGRVLLPSHPKQNGLINLNNVSLWTSAETVVSRDLFRALRAVTIEDKTPKENWKLRECPEGEEELYFSDNVVIWSRSDGNLLSHLIKTFTLENKIFESIWCQFVDEFTKNIVNSICVLDNISLEIFTTKGDHFPIALQFQVNKIFSTKFGLLLERLSVDNGSHDSIATPLPIIFGLIHPLKEIAPIIVNRSPPNAKTQQISYITSDDKLELVTIIEDKSLMVFYHKISGCHSFYLLRPVNEDEVKWASASSTSFDTRFDSPLSESPFMPCSRQMSLQNAFISSSSSPFRSLNNSKQTTLGLSSSPSTLNPSSRSIATGSSSSVLSPLRSSRLAVSPASPSLRAFGTPPIYSSSIIDPHMSRIKDESKNSSFNLLSLTPRKSRDFDFLTDDISEPIIPELSSDYLWSEAPKSSAEKASKIFITTDLMGQTFICLLMSQTYSLKLIRIEQSNDGQKIIFGSVNVIAAKDAEPVPSLNMILTVDLNNNLVLFCGLYKTSIIHLPPTLTTAFSNSLILSPSSTLSSRSLSYQSPSFKRTSWTTSSRPASATGVVNPFLSESRMLSPVINESDVDNSSFGSSLIQCHLLDMTSKI